MNKSLLPVCYLCLLLFTSSNTVSAATKSFDPEFRFGLGGGIQYAGLIGTQFNLVSNKHKVYLSLGFLGLGGGYDYALSPKVSIGVNFSEISGVFASATIASVNVNYHFRSAFDKSWVLGLDVGRRDLNTAFTAAELDSSNVAFVSVGYRF